MTGLRVGSVCTGYAGLDLAVHAVLGGETAWVADNDPGAAAVLTHRFPGVLNLGDITALDWSQVEPVDILCAGTPCQDISAAGKRAGMRKGTRSGLWLTVVRAIDVLRPQLVVFENVRGLLTARGDEPTDEHMAAEAARDLPAMRQLGRWLENERRIAVAKGDMRRVRQADERAARLMGRRRRAVALCEWHERRLVRAIGTVLGSLASLGYDAQWTTISAADVGAPHRRERVFLVARPAADPDGGECQRWRVAGFVAGPESAAPRAQGERERDGDAAGDRGPAPADADGATGGERRVAAPGEAKGRGSRADAGGRGGAPAADSECDGRPGRHPGSPRTADIGREGPRTAAPGCRPSASANTECFGLEGQRGNPRPGQGWPTAATGRQGPARGCVTAADWGRYAAAIDRWERTTGRAAPRPVEPGRTGERLSPLFVEWMMGLPEGWVTGVPGLSRNEQLKALGNGVVPQQGAAALELLLPLILGAAA